jgi:hypothetical protein
MEKLRLQPPTSSLEDYLGRKFDHAASRPGPAEPRVKVKAFN